MLTSSNCFDHSRIRLKLSSTQATISLLAIIYFQCCCPVLLNAAEPEVGRQQQQQLVSNQQWALGEDSWNYWWSYLGVSGPAYWGLMNLDWFMCDKGRRQSPINIETKNLVFDPNLKPLVLDDSSKLISGVLYNDGHALVFNTSSAALWQAKKEKVSFKLDGNNQVGGSSGKILNKRLSIDSIDDIFNFNETTSNYKTEVDLSELGQSIDLSIRQSYSPEMAQENTRPLSESQQQTASIEDQASSFSGQEVFLLGAGLMYQYKFEAMYLRFGLDSKLGSEHKINGHSYAAELQLIFYNSHLFKSYLEAQQKPAGLLAISVLVNEATDEVKNNSALLNSVLNEKLDFVRFRGNSILIEDFNLSSVLPETEQFVTYEGSLTTPGCHESVTWIVLNKPLSITRSNLNKLRSISADETQTTGALIANNLRPVQVVNARPIRTNIRPKTTDANQKPEACERLWTRFQYKTS